MLLLSFEPCYESYSCLIELGGIFVASTVSVGMTWRVAGRAGVRPDVLNKLPCHKVRGHTLTAGVCQVLILCLITAIGDD